MRTIPQTSGGVAAFRRTTLFAAVTMALAQGAMASTVIIVNKGADDSSGGTLREAIDAANFACSEFGDTSPVIQFDTSGGPFVIKPSAQLPTFQCFSTTPYTPTIDGNSAGGSQNTDPSGFNATFPVALDGGSEVSGGNCALQWYDGGYGGGLTVRGLEISGFIYGGYERPACGVLTLSGNKIHGNAQGVQADAGSVIGGPLPSDRNVIYDHSVFYGDAIDVDGGAISIVGNFLGTADGVNAAPNDSGIYHSGCCASLTGTIANNVIVSNDYAGISVDYDSYGAALTISGNKIGTDVTGTTMLGTGSFGISLYYSYGAQISGNVIAGASQNAIDSYSGTSVHISGNMIGVNAGGFAALPNMNGIYDAYSYGTTIDGANVVSGNSDTGIYLQSTTNATVSGNMIGTDASGSAAIPNTIGIYLGIVPANTLISNNTISGNTDTGVWSSDANDAQVNSNRIGTSADASRAIANGVGMSADCGERLSISGNTISGNRAQGLAMAAIQNSDVSGNYIGTNAAGGSLGNGGDGLDATHLTCGSIAYGFAIGAKSIVGGGANNESDSNNMNDNFVANNGGHGVFIQGGSNNTLVDNRVHGNSLDGIRVDVHCCDAYGGNLGPATGNSLVANNVYGNAAKNINLGFDGGPAPHQAYTDDVSRRPNHWQNTPVITSVMRDTLAGTTTIAFDLESVAGVYRIDLYSNPSLGNPAGTTYVGNTYATLAYGGAMSGSYAINSVTLDNFSMMATRDGPEKPVVVPDSSEFSTMVAASALPVPGVSVLPSSIDFGDVVVGRSSPSGTVTISSVGTAPYVISALRDGSCTGPAICSSGPFACSTSCVEGGTGYAAPASCTITASFQPSATGAASKSLALCDNVTGSPRTITFSGNGITQPLVDIGMSPATYYFGEVLVSARSASARFTVSNTGGNTVYLGTVATTGDFAITANTCAPTLAGGASCAADVVFAPLASGFASGTVTVTGSSAPPAALATRAKVTSPTGTTNTVSASLSGNGLQFGDLRLPDSLRFGTTVLHGSTLQQTVSLQNTGNGDLTLGTISVSGPFALTNPCPATIPSGGSCTLTVGFNPASLGTFTGTLTVVSDAPGGSRGIALSAQVIAESRPVVTLSSDNLGFGDRIVGSLSASQRVTITNEGSQEAALGTVTAGGTEDTSAPEFRVVATTCGATLAPQATCVADVVMQALGFGGRSGLLTVPSNSLRNPATAALSGRGCRPFSTGDNRSPRDPCAK